MIFVTILALLFQSSFEVASIKPNTGGDPGSRVEVRPGGRLIASNVPLKQLIMTAYGLKDFQISGGPGWIESDRFDVNAVANGNVGHPQVQEM